MVIHSYGEIVAVIGTALDYILGNLVVLINLGNIITSLGDGVMISLFL